MQGTQPISKLLENIEGNPQRLLAQAKTLQQLTQEVRQYLPEILAPYCTVANIRGHRLILHTDTAARATLLRYHIPSLINYLKKCQGLHTLTKATIKVRPLPPSSPPAPSRQYPRLTPTAATLLRNMANSLDNPPLKAALLRLANRTHSKRRRNTSKATPRKLL